ncbi:hypothetical protein KUV28_11630 [Ferrimonas balearica]|nr:hypothetical protein [Ferrimonas balearica]
MQDFVDISERNFSTYSNWFAKLLLLTGSEVDVVAKKLCELDAPEQPRSNILDYQATLTGRFPGMHEVEVGLPKFSIAIKPWSEWEKPSTSPGWWRAYNQVKHSRIEQFHLANLENVLFAYSGLLVLLRYFFRTDRNLQPYPELFDLSFPQVVVAENGRLQLPGI